MKYKKQIFFFIFKNSNFTDLNKILLPEIIIDTNIHFKIANSIKEFDDAKKLFQEYANSLDIDLCFQNFEEELKSIDQQYFMPKGALLLAYKDGIAIGCVALRAFDKENAELKRMFVKEEYRYYKIGRKLLQQIIEIAIELKYKKILLDTLPSMTQALNLYRSFEFYEIPSYRFNPIEGAVFMEKKIS